MRRTARAPGQSRATTPLASCRVPRPSASAWNWTDRQTRASVNATMQEDQGEGRGRRLQGLQGLEGLGRDAAEDFWEGVPGGEGVRESASKMPAPSRAYVIAY